MKKVFLPILLFLMLCMTACSAVDTAGEAVSSSNGERQDLVAQTAEEEILPQNDLYKPVIDLLRIYDSRGEGGSVIKTVPFGGTARARK